jgi:hypothetical protein
MSFMWRTRRPASTLVLLAWFTVAGVVVLAALTGLIAFIARQAGTAQAQHSAVQTTSVTARAVVEPRLDTRSWPAIPPR